MAKELAALLGGRFIERRDVLAIQRGNGSYTPERRPFKMGDLRAHLDGSRSYGHYLISPEGNCRLFAFDIDLRKTGTWTDDAGEVHEINPRQAWLTDHPAKAHLTVQLRCLAEALALRTRRLLELPVAVAYSGSKGLHVYAWTGPVPAAEAKAAAIAVLESFSQFVATRGNNFFHHREAYQTLEIEVFPKQDNLDGKDLGNLMRLPLGVNRRSGQRSYFLDLRAGYDTLAPADPEPILSEGADW